MLQAINKPADIIECTYGRVPIEQLLGIQAFSLDRVLAQEPDFLVSDSVSNMLLFN
jgi:G3E family GTPase